MTMDPLQMWWLNLNSERLLAIYCRKGQAKEEPFQYAASYMQKQLGLTTPITQSLHYDRSEDVGSEQCSNRMKEVMACLPNKIAYDLVITSYQNFAAVGIGANKRCCEKAAYLALATTSAIERSQLMKSTILSNKYTAQKT